MTSDRGRASTYDRPLVAALYDLDVRLTSRPIWGASIGSQSRVLEHLLEEGPVLDVPAGTGLITERALAGRPDPPLIVAVDLSGQVLRRARRRLGSRAVFVEADVTHLPFRDGAFAAAHSSNGFHLFPDIDSAAGELQRTCRPGGRVAVTTWTDGGHIVARWYQRLLARLGHVERPRPAGDYVATLEAAGFETEATDRAGTLLVWSGRSITVRP